MQRVTRVHQRNASNAFKDWCYQSTCSSQHNTHRNVLTAVALIEEPKEVGLGLNLLHGVADELVHQGRPRVVQPLNGLARCSGLRQDGRGELARHFLVLQLLLAPLLVWLRLPDGTRVIAGHRKQFD